MRYRQGENSGLWFRSGRVFRVDDQFYFYTREGIDVGPYESEVDAGVEAEMLVPVLRGLTGAEASRAIQDFAYSSVGAEASGSYLNSDGFTDYVVDETSTKLTFERFHNGL